MSGPPEKEAPGAGELTGRRRKLITNLKYAALALAANLFGSIFWFFEQQRWRVADQFENEESDW